MADKKISELASAGALAGTEVLPIVQSGETKKLALNAITTLGTIATGTWQGTQIANAYVATLTTAGKVANSATTATDANTASAIVARDASGNFSAGTITAALSGNASTAAALQTARNINGVSFNGTADITVTAAAGTLTGSTLASGVTASSLTSVGTLTSLAVSGNTTLNGVAYTWPATAGTNAYVLATNGSGTLSWVAQTGGGGGGGTTTFPLTAGSFLTGGTLDGSSAVTFAVDATSANTASKGVARDASGNFSAGAVTATSIVVSGTTSLNGVAYTWPASAGTNGQVLATNGAGTLSWVTGGGGGGGTTTFPLTAGTYLTGGTFDGSAAVTFAVDATPLNTALKVVARNGAGDFAAGVITTTGLQLSTTSIAASNTARIIWNNTDGVPEVRLLGGNVDLAVGETNVARVLNNTGSPLTYGQIVYITGASGQRATVALANAAAEATSTNVIGFVAEAIANNQEGFVRTSGTIKGLNTNAFNQGDLLYLSATTSGAFTNVRPTQPNHGVRVGYVIKKNLVDGHIFIDVNNGYEFEELHDVLITTPAANNMIRRNAGNTLWVNIAGPAGDVVGTTDSQTLTNKTISGASNTISNIANSSLTNSSVTVNGTSIALGASGTVTAAAGTLTGTTLNSTVVSSSLTSVGTLTAGAIGTGFTAIPNTALANSSVTINGTAVALGASGTVTAAAGTLTGTTLNSTVVSSSLTSVGTLTSLSVSGNATIAGTTTSIRGVSYVWPAAQGSASTVLTNDGSGNLSWAAGGGGSTFATLTVTGTTTLQQICEKITITAGSVPSALNFDALSQAIMYYTGNATANWTVNVRGNGVTTLNSMLAVGQSLTITVMATQGTTAYYSTGLFIDGTGQTLRWQNKSAPTLGTPSGIEIYTYTIIKTAATPTYIVLASITTYGP